jgi:hypothetical protein
MKELAVLFVISHSVIETGDPESTRTGAIPSSTPSTREGLITKEMFDCGEDAVVWPSQSRRLSHQLLTDGVLVELVYGDAMRSHSASSNWREIPIDESSIENESSITIEF